MPFIAWIITLFFTVENILPYFVGLSLTPKGAVFLGTVHHPGDYFYYVSQFAQGATRWLSTLDLYTAEPVRPTLVGWSNALLGHLLSLFGASPIFAYQISIAILTLLLFYASYVLAREVLGQKRLATITLYLFGLYHAFPIIRDGLPSYGDYFNNFAVPRVRFGAVPHQLLLASASIFLSFFILRYCDKQTHKSKKLLFGIAASSIILASLQPALWVTIIGIFCFVSFIYGLSRRDIKGILNTFIYPIFIASISGFLPILYLSNLFNTLPFVQLKTWEATQHTTFTVGHFISASGPIFLIALAGLPWFLNHATYKRVYIACFAVVSFILFLSPIPTLMGLSHVRFMSTLVILCLCIIATFGIEKLSAKSASFMHKTYAASRIIYPQLLVSISLILLSLYLLPNHLTTIHLASKFDPANAYHYLARSDYEFLQKVALASKPNDTYLVIWPYNTLFPAVTGKRSFHGHSLLTINSMQKDMQAVQFFDNKMSSSEAQMFLRDNHISHVVAYTWTNPPKELMTQTLTSGSLSLFAVNQEYLKPYSK